MGAVSYSYPADGNSEGTEYWDPHGHMDSPFDFNQELLRQKELLAKGFNKNGLKFKKMKGQWPAGIATPQDFGSFAAYEANAVDIENDLTADAEWYKKVPTIESWNETYAPGGKWFQYIRTKIGTTIPFLPGLGLHYHKNNNGIRDYLGRTDDGTESANDDVVGTISDMVEAGTDCLGFVQRAALYKENSYKWRAKMLPSGYAETGSVIDAPTAHNRIYPRILTDALEVGLNTSYVYSDLILDEEQAEIANNIRRIVPGDIFYYGNPGHIAIVNAVAYEDDGTADLSGITLIEATYEWNDSPNRRALFVLNKNTVQSYTGLNRGWKIVRLRTVE